MSEVPSWLPHLMSWGLVLFTLLVLSVGLVINRRGFLSAETGKDVFVYTPDKHGLVPGDVESGVLSDDGHKASRSLDKVFTNWGGVFPNHSPHILLRVVPEGVKDRALDIASSEMNQKVAGTVVIHPQYEWKWAWLTKLLRGRGPRFTVVVRYKDSDPKWSARLFAHELSGHLWPYLVGKGWNRDHTMPGCDVIEEKLLIGV